MGVKRVIVRESEVGQALAKLRTEKEKGTGLTYNQCRVVYAGHADHTAKGLSSDYVIIFANAYTPKPNQRNKKVTIQYVEAVKDDEGQTRYYFTEDPTGKNIVASGKVPNVPDPVLVAEGVIRETEEQKEARYRKLVEDM